MLRRISYLTAVALVPAALLYWVFGCSSSAELPGGPATPAAAPPSAPVKAELPPGPAGPVTPGVALPPAPIKWDVPTFPFPAAKEPSAVSDAKGLTERIHQAALEWLDRAIGQVDKMVPVAEAAVGRLIAGGKLFVCGNDGFVDELEYRAGGFSFIKIWDGHERPGPDDVMILGHFKPNDRGDSWVFFDSFHRYLNLQTPMAIHFTSLNWPTEVRTFRMPDDGFWGERLFRFDTGAPAGDSVEARALGQMATVALAWAFQAEMISAATRKDKTLATYSSDEEPNARGWDSNVRGVTFHPEHTVPSIPAGKLGKEYLRTCRDQIAKFLATQPEKVRLGAGRMAQCMKRGGKVWLTTTAEIQRNDCVLPRDLPVVWVGRDYMLINADAAARMPRGDMLLWVGYIQYPQDVVREALHSGCDCVVVSLDDGPTNDRVTHIAGCWKPYDSAVELKDYPIRVLPTSGVVQTLQWFSILGETAAAYGQGK